MEIIKVTGKKENCELIGFLPFDVIKKKEIDEKGVYTIYYEIQPEENNQPISNYLDQFENKKATIDTIKQSVDSNEYFALPLNQISKLLELKITGATVLEPWCCPWDGEWEPPSLYYFKWDNGVYENIDVIDDGFIQERAERLFSEYNTVDEDGEYFIP